MKRQTTYLLGITFLLLFSCTTEEKVEKKVELDPSFKHQLINWKAMNSEGWRNMSFPIWFSENLIDSNHIERIEVGFTSFSYTDSVINVTDTLPHKKIELYFREKGDVKKVKLTEFSNGIQLAQHIFSYPTPPDSLGYSPPAVSSNVKYRSKSMVSLFKTIEELQQYKRLILEEEDSTTLLYIDKSSQNELHHYFLLDSVNWNVSYIDHTFKPEGKNIFYYGSPKEYTSSFSLENLVEKSMQQKRNYYPTKTLKSQSFYTHDFVTKRTFKYDSSGVLTQLKDSLMTKNNEFLHSEIGKVKYRDSLPKEIVFFNAEDTLRTTPIKRIRLSYFSR